MFTYNCLQFQSINQKKTVNSISTQNNNLLLLPWYYRGQHNTRFPWCPLACLSLVASQLNNPYIEANSRLPHFQSAYQNGHSTYIAILCVWSDFLTAADQLHVMPLGLLDHSSMWDSAFRLTDIVLEWTWIKSFLSDRMQ